jgi:precorrin-4/cobalt-precorrin-4 C11-methyltransferase
LTPRRDLTDHRPNGEAQATARCCASIPSSLYGAIAEQMPLDQLGIDYDVTPACGYAAAAAVLKTELTPEVSQTVILTRTDGKASPMPNREDLATLGASGATLAIHLSVRNVREIVRELSPHYGVGCPAVVAYRVGWPDQLILRGTLETIGAQIREAKITRTALIFVGRVFESRDFTDSKLYDAAHRHILRPGKRSA